jgi:hypothetical protein
MVTGFRLFSAAMCLIQLHRRLAILALAGLSVACSTAGNSPKPAYTAEKFSSDSPFELHIAAGPLTACRYGQRALLSQGYQVNGGDAETIRGTKYFQPKADHQMQLDITLVCLPGADGTVIYASAIQTRYELKTSASNTGVSVAGIGSVSLPWSEGKEAMVKVGEETVTDPDFYGRLFELLKRIAE